MPQPHASAWQRIQKRAVKPLVGFMALFAFATYLLAADSGDKAWLLETANMWISGKHLYDEIAQPNMPFITWFYAIPVFLSRHTGIGDGQWLVLITYGLLILSLLLCRRIMAQHPVLETQPDKRFLHSVFLFLLFAFFADPRLFADRESLMVILAFPYFLRFMPSLASMSLPQSIASISALMAGVALCVKPQGILLIGAPLLLECLRQRSLKPLVRMESRIIALVQIVYLALVLSFTSDYFTILLPILLTTYSAVTDGLERIIFYSCSLFLLAVTLADCRLRDQSPYRRDCI